MTGVYVCEEEYTGERDKDRERDRERERERDRDSIRLFREMSNTVR